MMNFLCVALGGACGAMGRYAISLIPLKVTFPILTFATNILGAMLIGFILGMVSSKDNISEGLILFLKVGVCGGFTTFSTFSVEVLNLLDTGRTGLGLAYAVLSVICCVAGVYLGQMIALHRV